MAENERLGASFSIDVTDLKAGLKTANKLIRESESEFKAAAAGMDDWGRSEEGLKAKIKSLTDITEIQRKKVDALQGEYDDLVHKGMDPTSDAAIELRTKINKEKEALEKNEKELRNQTEALEDLGEEADDAGDELEDVSESAEKSSGGFTVLKGALADLVADGFRKAIDAAKEFAVNMIDTAAEVKAANSQFSQTFGELEKDATTAIKNIADSTGILETRLQSTGAGIYAFARSSGASTEEAMSLMQTALVATADSAAYYDRSLEESAETLQSFLKGNFANDAALGVSATEFTRNAKATELFGKKYNDLTEIQKQQTLLKMVTDAQEMSGAMGQAAREADGWENVQGNLNETWKQFQAQVGTPFLEALIPVIQDITSSFSDWRDTIDWDEFGKKIENISEKIKDGLKWVIDNKDTLIAGISGIGAAFATFKVATMIMGVVGAIKAFQLANEGATVAQALLNTTMLANPVGLITVAVGALVAAIVLLIKNWDSVKEAALICWDAIKQAASAVADWFSEKWAAVSEWFSELWDGIKEKASAVWEGIKAVFSTVATWFDENVIQPVKAFFEPLFKVIGELAEGCWILIQTVWGIVASWFDENVIQPVKNFFSETWDAISQKASDAWQKIKDVFAAVSGWFSDNVTQPIKNFFSETWNNVKEKASQAWEKIKSVFSPVSDWFKDKFSTAWQKVKDVFSTGGEVFGGIVEGIEKAFKKVVNAIIRGINKTIAIPFNAINSMLDKIRNVSIAGVQPFSGLITRFTVPEIPELAKGGVVRNATNAIIGEDGEEAVLPLEKNTEWMDKLADKIASKNKSVVVNQTNNYSQAHSRYELYKSKKQTTAAVRLALQEV